eukprot:356008-Chlamydomonas_euryale.AAC.3
MDCYGVEQRPDGSRWLCDTCELRAAGAPVRVGGLWEVWRCLEQGGGTCEPHVAGVPVCVGRVWKEVSSGAACAS